MPKTASNPRFCEIPGCARKHYARELCQNHYKQTREQRENSRAAAAARYKKPEYRAKLKAARQSDYQVKRAKTYRDKNKDKRWAAALMRKFGMSPKDYNNQLSEQGGGCSLCGKTAEQEGRRLAVDHCHTTNRNRGLLCVGCNVWLSKFERPGWVATVIEYLEKYSD